MSREGRSWRAPPSLYFSLKLETVRYIKEGESFANLEVKRDTIRLQMYSNKDRKHAEVLAATITGSMSFVAWVTALSRQLQEKAHLLEETTCKYLVDLITGNSTKVAPSTKLLLTS